MTNKCLKCFVLRKALERAREDMEGWGAYAGEYFQEKWDLAGDLAAIDIALSNETVDWTDCD